MDLDTLASDEARHVCKEGYTEERNLDTLASDEARLGNGNSSSDTYLFRYASLRRG